MVECASRLMNRLRALADEAAQSGGPPIVVDVDGAALRATLDAIGLVRSAAAGGITCAAPSTLLVQCTFHSPVNLWRVRGHSFGSIFTSLYCISPTVLLKKCFFTQDFFWHLKAT